VQIHVNTIADYFLLKTSVKKITVSVTSHNSTVNPVHGFVWSEMELIKMLFWLLTTGGL